MDGIKVVVFDNLIVNIFIFIVEGKNFIKLKMLPESVY